MKASVCKIQRPDSKCTASGSLIKFASILAYESLKDQQLLGHRDIKFAADK